MAASLALLTAVVFMRLASPPTVAESESTPSAALVAEHTFNSAALRRTMPYTLYLPAGYSSDEAKRYPVLYMLHGLGGSHTIEWQAYGLLERADQLAEAGTIQPMIIVLPEGESSYWVDHADGTGAWGAYVAQDLVATIDASARTIAKPCARAIGGNSMGGHGAMQLALTYPKVFGIVGAHSPTLRQYEARLPYFGDPTYFAEHDPKTLFATRWAAAQRLRWFIDIGDRDPWLPAVEDLHAEMQRLQIPHDLEVMPGPHQNEYWIGNIDRYLTQYDSAFKDNEPHC